MMIRRAMIRVDVLFCLLLNVLIYWDMWAVILVKIRLSRQL